MIKEDRLCLPSHNPCVIPLRTRDIFSSSSTSLGGDDDEKDKLNHEGLSVDIDSETSEKGRKGEEYNSILILDIQGAALTAAVENGMESTTGLSAFKQGTTTTTTTHDKRLLGLLPQLEAIENVHCNSDQLTEEQNIHGQKEVTRDFHKSRVTYGTRDLCLPWGYMECHYSNTSSNNPKVVVDNSTIIDGASSVSLHVGYHYVTGQQTPVKDDKCLLVLRLSSSICHTEDGSVCDDWASFLYVSSSGPEDRRRVPTSTSTTKQPEPVELFWVVFEKVFKTVQFLSHPILDSSRLDYLNWQVGGGFMEKKSGETNPGIDSNAMTLDQNSTAETIIHGSNNSFWFIGTSPYLHKENDVWRVIEVDSEIYSEVSEGSRIWFKALPNMTWQEPMIPHKQHDPRVRINESELGYSMCLCTSLKTYSVFINSLDGVLLLALRCHLGNKQGTFSKGVESVSIVGVVRSVLSVRPVVPPLAYQVTTLANIYKYDARTVSTTATPTLLKMPYLSGIVQFDKAGKLCQCSMSTSQLLHDVQASPLQLMQFLLRMDLRRVQQLVGSGKGDTQALTDGSLKIESWLTVDKPVFLLILPLPSRLQAESTFVEIAFTELDVGPTENLLYVNGMWAGIELSTWVQAVKQLQTLALLHKVNWYSTKAGDKLVGYRCDVNKSELGSEFNGSEKPDTRGNGGTHLSNNVHSLSMVRIAVFDALCDAIVGEKVNINTTISSSLEKSLDVVDGTLEDPWGEGVESLWWWRRRNSGAMLFKVGVVYQILGRVGDIWQAVKNNRMSPDFDGRLGSLGWAKRATEKKPSDLKLVVPWAAAPYQDNSAWNEARFSVCDNYDIWTRTFFRPVDYCSESENRSASSVQNGKVTCFKVLPALLERLLAFADGQHIEVQREMRTGSNESNNTKSKEDEMFFRFNLRKVHKLVALFVLQYEIDDANEPDGGLSWDVSNKRYRKRDIGESIGLRDYLNQVSAMLHAFPVDLLEIWKTTYIVGVYSQRDDSYLYTKDGSKMEMEDVEVENLGYGGCEGMSLELLRHLTQGFPEVRNPLNKEARSILLRHFVRADRSGNIPPPESVTTGTKRAAHNVLEMISTSTSMNISNRLSCDLSILRGEAYFNEQTCSIHYLPSSFLPVIIRERLVILFSLKTKWYEEEIQQYVASLLTVPIESVESGTDGSVDSGCNVLQAVLMGHPLGHCRSINVEFSHQGYREELCVFYCQNLPLKYWETA